MPFVSSGFCVLCSVLQGKSKRVCFQVRGWRMYKCNACGGVMVTDCVVFFGILIIFVGIITRVFGGKPTVYDFEDVESIVIEKTPCVTVDVKRKTH